MSDRKMWAARSRLSRYPSLVDQTGIQQRRPFSDGADSEIQADVAEPTNLRKPTGRANSTTR
ncbi:hypothetical protein K523DRAFT_325714 [Schizophyllum commune Tattone D]|nr:hypothetical protein K523DRAFT_325714 [Schizophyllum commune Tattone D]